MRRAYLVMVTAEDNHNKYYEMTENKDSLTVRYGRIGARGMTREYPLSSWDRLYNQKLAKGYRDMTGLHNDAILHDHAGISISDKDVERLYRDILKWSNKALKTNYTVNFEAVTPQMIKRAENLLNGLKKQEESRINDTLLELYSVIPRRMSKVDDYLYTKGSDVGKILAREYDVLDVMRARVCGNITVGNEGDPLEKLGLDISLVTDDKRLSQIKSHLGECDVYFKRAFRVRNKKLDERFERTMKKRGYTNKDIHYFYHGSRNQNWYGLLTKGPLLHPDAVITGKMFGEGIYFAPKARKSVGYTSLRGSYWAGGSEKQAFLAVYKVLYNNPKHVDDAASYLNSRNICPYDATFAHAGMALRNDEVIVYREDQVTLQYLIELAA